MTQAVCFKCEVIKFGAFVVCDKCEALSESEDDLMLSVVLTDQYFGPAKWGAPLKPASCLSSFSRPGTHCSLRFAR